LGKCVVMTWMYAELNYIYVYIWLYMYVVGEPV
jgi:hypothetical protein